ncbi:MAG: MoxR family ATPase [Gammaproteobacteria bacterium]|nr:MoxR family ATPase [Gammaproteobacteria bacterium]MYD79121.1 MoxR family ATPase [Gammaproteobacteria bacterium]
MAEQATTNVDSRAAEQAAHFKSVFQDIRSEVNKMMVGQPTVVDGVLTALMAGGHVLLEGVPGLGKTMLVRCLSDAVSVKFSRIQFTPDMMPADIQGTMVLTETASGAHELSFQEGPLIANLVLADEINRATPKTQSALLEAMQERQVTVGNRTLTLDEPYCVMATQNPVEQEGTYPLPEAQLDRFLFKLLVDYPEENEYYEIIDRTTGTEDVDISHITDGAEIVKLREIARAVAVPTTAKTYAIRLVMATQPNSSYATDKTTAYVSLGSSPRGVQGLMLAAKVQAILNDRYSISTDDIKAVAYPVLRHRIILNFQAQASNVTPDSIIEDILEQVKLPRSVD